MLVWTNPGREITDLGSADDGVFGRRYDAAGNPLGPELHVNTRRRGDQTSPALAMSSDTRAFVVVWQSRAQDGSEWGIYGQRFAANGERLGGEFRVSTRTGGDQTRPSVAMDQEGNFAVAWTGPDPLNIFRTAIFAQRFSASGERIGGEIQVSEAVFGYEELPRITMDPQGNFAVSWDYWPYLLTLMRLYRADGTPVQGPVQLTYVPGHMLSQIRFCRQWHLRCGLD